MHIKTKIWIGLLASACILAIAQGPGKTGTLMVPGQLAVTVNPAGAPGILVYGPDGKVYPAPLAGARIDNVDGAYVVTIPAGVPGVAGPAGVAGVSPTLPRLVLNEIPAATAPATWTLTDAPIGGAVCSRNGIVQTPGLDYTLIGKSIESLSWTTDDALLCHYTR